MQFKQFLLLAALAFTAAALPGRPSCEFIHSSANPIDFDLTCSFQITVETTNSNSMPRIWRSVVGVNVNIYPYFLVDKLSVIVDNRRDEFDIEEMEKRGRGGGCE